MSKTYQIVNKDIAYGTSGGVLTVTGTEKARQDISESIGVATQADGFGFGIVDLVGTDDGPETNIMGIEFLLRQRIQDGFQRLVQLQRGSLTNRTPDEIYTEITNLQVQRQRADVRVYRWSLDVQTISGKLKTLSGTIVPG